MKTPSRNTLKKVATGALGTLVADCSIYVRTRADDGYALVDTEALRDVTKCRITKLSETQLSDQQRAREVEHFEVALPADCEINVGERLATTWTPDGGTAQSISLEITEVNTPRQTTQMLVLAVGILVA